MSAGGVVLVDEPTVNIARQEVSVGDSRNTSVELEIAGGDIAPVCVVLVDLVELAADLDRMSAANERNDIRDVVDSLAQNGVDIPVFAASGAQSNASNASSGIDRNFGKHIGRRIGAVGGLKPDRRRGPFSKGGRHVFIELAAGTYMKLVQQSRANRIHPGDLTRQIVCIPQIVGRRVVREKWISRDIRHRSGKIVEAERESLIG